MKTFVKLGFFIVFFSSAALYAQLSGNFNYQARSVNKTREVPKINMPATGKEMTLTANAIYNITASSYVGVFSLTQVGESIEETDKLMNERIEKIKTGVDDLKIGETRIYVDMISLVPVYEYEVSKKIFSKNTYTEVPKGFELKKNLHIRFNDPEALDRILSICATSEVYDLVKVDYFVDNSEAIYDSLRTRAAKLIQEKIQFYKELGIDLSDTKRIISEGDQAFFPMERYSSYQAFANYSLEARSKAEVKKVTKATAQYYRPVPTRHYDIVIHPEIVEPAIQFAYTLNVRFVLEEEKPETKQVIKKEVYLILPNGDMKSINFD